MTDDRGQMTEDGSAAPYPISDICPPSSALLPARIGLQSGGLDAGDRAGLILVGGVAGNPDGPDDVAAGVADQHAARIGDHAPAARRIECIEELRRIGSALEQRARSEAHAECAPGLAIGNVVAKDAGFVFALERDQMTAGVEHRDGHRHEIHLTSLVECDIHDGAGLREGNRHDASLRGNSGLTTESYFPAARVDQYTDMPAPSVAPRPWRLASSKHASVRATSGISTPHLAPSASMTRRSLMQLSSVNMAGPGSSPLSSLTSAGPRTLSTFAPPELSDMRSIRRPGSRPNGRQSANASPSACQ